MVVDYSSSFHLVYLTKKKTCYCGKIWNLLKDHLILLLADIFCFSSSVTLVSFVNLIRGPRCLICSMMFFQRTAQVIK